MADVNRAQTEFLTFARCKEASYGELDSTDSNNIWTKIEPDAVSQFGNQYVRERRDPFATDRLLRRQQLTGIASAVSLEGDMTDDHMDWLAPMLVLADWQSDLVEITAVTVTRAGFTVSSTDHSKLINSNRAEPIVQIPENSDGLTAGIFRLTLGTSPAITTMTRLAESSADGAERTIIENTPAFANQTAKTSTSVKMQVIGYALIGSNSNKVTISKTGLTQAGSNNANFDVANSGLRNPATNVVGDKGKGVFITVENSAPTGARKYIGFARFSESAVGSVTVENLSGESGSQTLGNTDNAYVFYSKWVKNVPADNSKWNEDSYSLAAQYARVDGSNSLYERVQGCHLNGLSLRFPMQSRVRMQADFIGQRKFATDAAPSNFAGAANPVSKEAISTSVDIGEARLINTEDDSSIASLLKSVDIAFGNSIEGDYVLDKIGSVGPQIGKFQLSLTCSALVTSRDMFRVTEQDTPGAFMLAAGTDEGWWMFDVPSLTLTSDRKMLERNMSLKLDFETDYFINEDYETAVIISRFPWLPIRRDVS